VFKKGGRPEHKVTKGMQNLVATLAYGDLTQEQIAEELGISVPTLVKHYADDIKRGKAKIVGALMSASLKNAIEGKDASAARERMFHLERKAGFTRKETVDLNHTGEIRNIGHFYGESWTPDNNGEEE